MPRGTYQISEYRREKPKQSIAEVHGIEDKNQSLAVFRGWNLQGRDTGKMAGSQERPPKIYIEILSCLLLTIKPHMHRVRQHELRQIIMEKLWTEELTQIEEILKCWPSRHGSPNWTGRAFNRDQRNTMLCEEVYSSSRGYLQLSKKA